MKLYAMRDEKMDGYYSAPFEAPDDQSAVCSVRDGLIGAGKNSVVALKARDSVLVCVGEFDRSTGNIQPKKYDVAHLSDLPLYEEVEA